ncbi:MerR family transcriptional regulator [Streptomyces spirodelae]|uniref:MerR family transcriptional regulator n=1 Tax=Streptomyces spirodelae TaxID=2812904 RepID=A0ABS3WZJ7_9ACTN|nr:MerR family transcriptional regulator [Streptomyces spirodelae]MBO8188537.1 MerR family transcriptional regulator [Streptomyces spirodelae]
MTSTGGEGTAAGDSSLLDGPPPASGREVAPGRPSPAPSPGPLPGGASGPTAESPAEQVGYRGPTACSAAGITYRQLDYWARTGLVEPSIRPAYGSGTQRLYSFQDIVVLKIVKRLLDTGVSLQNIRAAVRHLRSRGRTDLARMTLMSDGATVYECSSPDEVVDLLQGGQGVFGIAVGVVWKDVEGALSQLHGERVDTGETLVRDHPEDELARRRNRAG